MTLLEVKALKKTYTTRLGGHLVPALTKANCQVKCNTSAGEANRRHFLGL